MTPNLPSQTAPTCSVAGTITAPAAQTGVRVSRTDLGDGKVQFVSTPATGYSFTGEAQSVSTTVQARPRLTGSACGDLLGDDDAPTRHADLGRARVEGTRAVKPPAVKAAAAKAVAVQGTPTVRGTSAAVPTAVDAGLSGATQNARPGARGSGPARRRPAAARVPAGRAWAVAGTVSRRSDDPVEHGGHLGGSPCSASSSTCDGPGPDLVRGQRAAGPGPEPGGGPAAAAPPYVVEPVVRIERRGLRAGPARPAPGPLPGRGSDPAGAAAARRRPGGADRRHRWRAHPAERPADARLVGRRGRAGGGTEARWSPGTPCTPAAAPSTTWRRCGPATG